MTPRTGLAIGLAAITALALPIRWLGPSRCRCGRCRYENPLAPWKRRVQALVRPGRGWAARTRYGLTRREHEERRRAGWPVSHPDWITGDLPEDGEELLAELDATTWEGRS